MVVLLRTRATFIWLVLLAATVGSWAAVDLGAAGDANAHRALSVLVLVVGFVKLRLVGLYFMDLRHAPALLRTIFEIYALAVCGVVVGFYLSIPS